MKTESTWTRWYWGPSRSTCRLRQVWKIIQPYWLRASPDNNKYPSISAISKGLPFSPGMPGGPGGPGEPGCPGLPGRPGFPFPLLNPGKPKGEKNQLRTPLQSEHLKLSLNVGSCLTLTQTTASSGPVQSFSMYFVYSSIVYSRWLAAARPCLALRPFTSPSTWNIFNWRYQGLDLGFLHANINGWCWIN